MFVMSFCLLRIVERMSPIRVPPMRGQAYYGQSGHTRGGRSRTDKEHNVTWARGSGAESNWLDYWIYLPNIK